MEGFVVLGSKVNIISWNRKPPRMQPLDLNYNTREITDVILMASERINSVGD